MQAEKQSIRREATRPPLEPGRGVVVRAAPPRPACYRYPRRRGWRGLPLHWGPGTWPSSPWGTGEQALGAARRLCGLHGSMARRPSARSRWCCPRGGPTCEARAPTPSASSLSSRSRATEVPCHTYYCSSLELATHPLGDCTAPPGARAAPPPGGWIWRGRLDLAQKQGRPGAGPLGIQGDSLNTNYFCKKN
jgi:hypothetical protein